MLSEWRHQYGHFDILITFLGGLGGGCSDYICIKKNENWENWDFWTNFYVFFILFEHMYSPYTKYMKQMYLYTAQTHRVHQYGHFDI